MLPKGAINAQKNWRAKGYAKKSRFCVSTDTVFERALQLRVAHGLKTPDALHLATAMVHGCQEFWTNDDRLSKVAGSIAVNIFSESGDVTEGGDQCPKKLES
jgi:predicted nucleic acid-binding protein